MNKKQLDFIRRFTDGTIDDISYHINPERDSVIGLNYINEIEEGLRDECISYNDTEKEQMLTYFVSAMKNEYGSENVYYKGFEHIIPANGNFETVNNQMAIVVYKSSEE